MEVLKSTPGPTHWYTPEYPIFDGPSGTKLHFVSSGSHRWGTALVPEGRKTPWYLGLGFYCYVAKVAADRLLVWRHVGEHPKPLRWDFMRMSVFDTCGLGPIGWFPQTEKDDPVTYTAGLIASVDLPATWERGRHSFEFPEVFKAISETIVLVSIYHDPKGLEEAQYLVRPAESVVDVVALDWWNEGDFDFGYQWITKVGRDAGTGQLFGTGFRIKPFVMKETGEFIAWIQPPPESPKGP